MRVAEDFVTYFFGAIIVMLLVVNGSETGMIISEFSKGANGIVSAFRGAQGGL